MASVQKMPSATECTSVWKSREIAWTANTNRKKSNASSAQPPRDATHACVCARVNCANGPAIGVVEDTRSPHSPEGPAEQETGDERRGDQRENDRGSYAVRPPDRSFDQSGQALRGQRSADRRHRHERRRIR